MDKERKKDGVMEISCIVQASPSAEVCARTYYYCPHQYLLLPIAIIII